MRNANGNITKHYKILMNFFVRPIKSCISVNRFSANLQSSRRLQAPNKDPFHGIPDTIIRDNGPIPEVPR